MDVCVNQQQLSPSEPLADVAEATEETPLTDIAPAEGEEFLEYAEPEVYDWNTSLISQICRDGDMHRLRLFVEFSRQMESLAEYAGQIADRLDPETGLSPLHYAARYQQLHICLILLSNIQFKYGVNIKDANDRTPIHSAFRSSNSLPNLENQFNVDTDFGEQLQSVKVWRDEYTTEILASDHPLVYLFAKANGDINAPDKYLLTPLHYAVARNHLPGVRQLISLGANIEAQDRQGIRPFHLACKEGYLSLVEYLMEQGVDVQAIDVDRWTPLHYACAKGHYAVVQWIHSKEPLIFQEILELKTNTDATCLHLAVQDGNVQLVQHILTAYTHGDLKVFINEQTEPLGTALHIAAKFCDPPMIDLLYANGADPTILNSNQQTPLHIASASNRLDIVQALHHLTQSLLLEVKDHRGRTALSVTTHVDIIDELIAFGADVASLDHNHMNAIMIAVSTGQLAVVGRLLSVLNEQLVAVLDQVEKQHDYSLFLIAVQSGSIEMCSLLLTHPHVRWDTVDKHRRNAWHIAARNNHDELIEFLCNYIRKSDQFMSTGSRSYPVATMVDFETINRPVTSSILRPYIDAQNEDGKTPLHLAAEQGHAASIRLLLDYGADALLANYLGQLPLHAAIQNGHSQCVALLIQTSLTYMTEFRSVLSRRQSPLIPACQNGFVDIVQLLVAENIGVDFDQDKEDTALEIAIKHRQIDTIHVLLEHPHTEYWLMSTKNSTRNKRQSPLRDMIRYMPDCARHAFDKLILKTNEIDLFGEVFERMVYKYKYIDDYFMNNDRLYTTSSRQLYRNHPLIIALDHDHHSLMDHPLAVQLMSRKWKLYRPLFYFPRILAFLLLFVLTLYTLSVPAPIGKSSSPPSENWLSSFMAGSAIRWTIMTLSVMNLLKILFEMILYRGFRVPFAQLFGIISFTSSLVAFIPYRNPTDSTRAFQWQVASLAVLFQWFNIVVMLRSVPFFGNVLVMLESIRTKFTLLLLATSPVLIAFTISAKMIFFNQPAFVTLSKTLHKSASMLIGEYDYETLFFTKETFTAASFIFILFIVLMAVVFINLLLGIAVGDIQDSVATAEAKANAYWIRELIYIEATLPSKAWMKANVTEHEVIDHYEAGDSTKEKIDSHEEDEDELLMNHPHAMELRKLVDILEMMCLQAKEVLEKEFHLERTLKQLLSRRKARDSTVSSLDQFFTVT